MESAQKKNRKDPRYYPTLKLYNDAFSVGFPIIFIFFILQVFFEKRTENTVLFLVVITAMLFFKLLRNNKMVMKHHVCFHQFFVFTAVVITAVWFINFSGTTELFYLLFIGSIASYLMLEMRTTVSYYIAYHIFLFVLYCYYPSLVKLAYIFYSLAFAFASIFVSRWLNQIIKNSTAVLYSEKKYRSLFENGNSAVILLKPLGEKLEVFDVSMDCERVFGYKKEEIIKQPFSSLCLEPEEKKKAFFDSIWNLKGQERIDAECLFGRKNKESFIAEISIVLIYFNEERIIQILINDVSEKRKNELELSETTESFKNIVENSPASMFIFSENQLIYNNPNAERLTKEFLVQDKKDVFDIFPKRHKYLLSELMNEASNKVSSYTEITLGEEEKKRYSINLVKIIYKGKNAILLILMDITLQNEYTIQKVRAEIAEDINKKLSEEIKKHKETQKDLIENTSKLNALFESSSSLFILTIDRDLNISSFNSSFKKMMHFYLGVEVKIGDDFLNTFPIEEAAYGKLIKRFKRALRGESVEIISHFPTKKGEIWVESFISPVKVEGESIKEIAFIAHNITEKVENERKVLDSEANNRATVSAIPDMLFKVNKKGSFTDFRLNDEGAKLLEEFAFTTDLLNMHIFDVFKNQKQARIFFHNIEKSLRTGKVHTQNFIIPFIIGRTDKRKVYENRYSRVNANEVIVITRDVTDKVEFETQLIESVKEKEILLKEVHHRVKNNLQVISSILNLQSSYVEDEKTLEIINESQNRIRSMSYIHESLYQTKDFSSIDFHDYITNLVQNLVHSYQLYSGKTNLNLDIDHVQLILDQAIPCGLILNELVSNSLKYAYPEGVGGKIEIEIKEIDGKIKMRVEDFGSGLPEGFKIEESDSLGLGLVDTLVDQIDGELILKTENGTKYLIIFEKEDL